MRDKRVIIIKTPPLQKIRNNLRLLWLKAVSHRWNELFDEMELISQYDDGRTKSVRHMTLKEKGRFREIQNEQNLLKNLAKRSICKCVACGKADRDMVFNKAYDAWYCIKCYGMERSTALERTKTRQKKEESCEDRAIEEHSRTFLSLNSSLFLF